MRVYERGSERPGPGSPRVRVRTVRGLTDRPLKPRFRGHITLILILDTNPKPNREETPKNPDFFLYIKYDFEVGISPLMYHQIRGPAPSTMVYFRGNPVLMEEN